MRTTPAVACLLLLLAGCGPPPATLPALHPTTGALTRDGKAVAGGALRFHPVGGEDANTIVTAEVGTDGTFTVHTVSGAGKAVGRSAGAPTGKYHVTYTPPAENQGVPPADLPDPVTIEPKANVLSLKLPK
jgi:hypothetical protein